MISVQILCRLGLFLRLSTSTDQNFFSKNVGKIFPIPKVLQNLNIQKSKKYNGKNQSAIFLGIFITFLCFFATKASLMNPNVHRKKIFSKINSVSNNGQNSQHNNKKNKRAGQCKKVNCQQKRSNFSC